MPLAVHHWASKDRCNRIECDTLPVGNPETGHRVVAHRFTGGTDGCEVWLYEVIGGKHSWFFDRDIDTGEELWKFFSKYIR